MGRFSRFLRLCAVVFVSFFAVDAFGAGYTCPTYKKYIECKAGYYFNGNMAGNACLKCPVGFYCPGGTVDNALNTKLNCNTGTSINQTGPWTSKEGAMSRSECYRTVYLSKLGLGMYANGTLSMRSPVTLETNTATGTNSLSTQCYYGLSCDFPTVTQKASTSETTVNALYHPAVSYTGGWVATSNDVSGGTKTSFVITSTEENLTYFPAKTSAPIRVTLDAQGATSEGTNSIFSKYGTGLFLDIASTKPMMTSLNPITVPQRTGYVFDGYYSGQNGTGTLMIDNNGYYLGGASTLTSSVVWYASWLPCEKGYYCPAGSSSTTQNACPTNWDSKAAAGSQSQCYRTVTLNWGNATGVTLTWTDPVSGAARTWTPSSSVQTQPIGCYYNTECDMPSVVGLTRSGYKIFDGWYSQSVVPNTVKTITRSPKIVSTASSVTYYPAMRAVLTMALDNQSATTSGTTAIYGVYGDGIYLDSALTKLMTVSNVLQGANPITVPTRAGYVFDGYYTQANCSGVRRINADGRIATNFTPSDSTFYACWKSCAVGYYCPAGSTSTTQNACPYDGNSVVASATASQCYLEVMLDTNGMNWSDDNSSSKRSFKIYNTGSATALPNASKLYAEGFNFTGKWSPIQPNPVGAYSTDLVPEQYTTITYQNASQIGTLYAVKQGYQVNAYLLPDIYNGDSVEVTCGQYSGKCVLPDLPWSPLANNTFVGWTLALADPIDMGEYSGRVFYPGEDVSALGFSCCGPTKLEFVPAVEYLTCPNGRYPSNGVCTQCPVGNYCTNNTVKKCPNGMTSSAGNASINNCRYDIKPGEMWNSSTKDIEPCPRGYFCSNSYQVTYSDVQNNRQTKTQLMKDGNLQACYNDLGWPYTMSDLGAVNFSECYAGFVVDKNGGTGALVTYEGTDPFVATEPIPGTQSGMAKFYNDSMCKMPTVTNLTKTGYVFSKKWGFDRNCNGSAFDFAEELYIGDMIPALEDFNIDNYLVPEWITGLDGQMGLADELLVGTVGTLYACNTLQSIKCNAGTYLPAGATTCVTCPEGSYCPGDTYLYYADMEQGKIPCPDHFTSDEGAKGRPGCYIDLPHGFAAAVNQGTGSVYLAACNDSRMKNEIGLVGRSTGHYCPGGRFNYMGPGVTGLQTCPGNFTSGESTISSIEQCTFTMPVGYRVDTCDYDNVNLFEHCEGGSAYCPGYTVTYGEVDAGNSIDWCSGGNELVNYSGVNRCPENSTPMPGVSDGQNRSTYCTCNTGYYVSDGASTITNKTQTCEPNQYTCAAGKYLPAGATTCVTCSAGAFCSGGTFTYSDKDQGNELCAENTDGKYPLSDAGAVVVGQCYLLTTPGYWVPEMSNGEDLCPENHYCLGGEEIYYTFDEEYDEGGRYTGGSAECAEGFDIDDYSANPQKYLNKYPFADAGSSAPQACYTLTQPGYYVPFSMGGQVECPTGVTYCPGGVKVFSYSSDQTQDIGGDMLCPYGYRDSTVAGKLSIQQCMHTVQAGYILHEPMTTNDIPCNAGYYQGQRHTVGYGMTSGDLGISCLPCNGMDKFQDKTGQASCKTVLEGYYTIGCGEDGTACTGEQACSAGHYCTGGIENACPTQDKFQDETGQTSCKTVTWGYYTTKDGAECTDGVACTGQAECLGKKYCVAGDMENCPDPMENLRNTDFSSTNESLIMPAVEWDQLVLAENTPKNGWAWGSNLIDRKGVGDISGCQVLSWYDPAETNGVAGLYEYANYNPETQRYDNTSAWSYLSVAPGYYLTGKTGCGAYAHYNTVEKCESSFFCPGKERVSCDSSNQSTVHTDYFGREKCTDYTDGLPYNKSGVGATSVNQCYITTTPGRYIAEAYAAQTECPGGYYCPATDIYWGATGGNNACPAANDDTRMTTFPASWYPVWQDGHAPDNANMMKVRDFKQQLWTKGVGSIGLCRAQYFITNAAGDTNIESVRFNENTGDYDTGGDQYYATLNPGFYFKTRYNDVYCSSAKDPSTRYMYYRTAVQCPEGSYCPGYASNSLVPKCSSGEYLEEMGRESCAALVDAQGTAGLYPYSPVQSSSQNQCYLNTTPGNYVAETYAKETTCLGGSYCTGNIHVNYGSTGGITACPAAQTFKMDITDYPQEWYPTWQPGHEPEKPLMQERSVSVIDWASAKGKSRVTDCCVMYGLKNDAGFLNVESVYFDPEDGENGKYSNYKQANTWYYSVLNPGFFYRNQLHVNYCRDGGTYKYYRSAEQCPVGSYCPGFETRPLCADGGEYGETMGYYTCANKPDNSYYTTVGWTNAQCPWTCDSGFNESLDSNGNPMCGQLCTVPNMSKIKTSTGASVNLFATKGNWERAIAVQKDDNICYAPLLPSNGVDVPANSIRVNYGGVGYYAPSVQ